MSKPVTLKPASERRRESGSPTYPSPITPILAVRVSMRVMRSCAIFGKTTTWFVIDIVTIIASVLPQPKLHESRIDPPPLRLDTYLILFLRLRAGFLAPNLDNRKDTLYDTLANTSEKYLWVEDRCLVISSQ